MSLKKKHAEGMLLGLLLLGLAASYLNYSGQRTCLSSGLTGSGEYVRLSAIDPFPVIYRWERTQGTKYEPG